MSSPRATVGRYDRSAPPMLSLVPLPMPAPAGRSKSSSSNALGGLLAPGASESPYAALKGVITVVDAETGLPLILNTKTALDAALERGDEGHGNTFSSSSVLHALPRLADDVDKSASLHMFIFKQRQTLRETVAAQCSVEAGRRRALREEPMQWRRVHMRKDYAITRIEEQKALEVARTAQEKELLVVARRMGLL